MATEWIFTFGNNHKNPVTGVSLGRRFVRIRGEYEEARSVMVSRFGLRWAFQRASEEEAGVEEYGLMELRRDDWPPPPVDANRGPG